MRRSQGFTLIEVLVALAIVAIGMAAVLGALSSSANTSAYMRDKTFAQWVALNHITMLRLSGQMTQTGTSDGDTDFAGRKWHWRREVTATQVPGVVRIDVKVRPAEIKGDDDNGWFTTVSGIQGDAVGAPNGYQPDWGAQGLPGMSPQGGKPAVLYANDAGNVSIELYNSNKSGKRDLPGAGVKFTVPTVADGKVLVGTQSELDIYGLHSHS